MLCVLASLPHVAFALHARVVRSGFSEKQADNNRSSAQCVSVVICVSMSFLVFIALLVVWPVLSEIVVSMPVILLSPLCNMYTSTRRTARTLVRFTREGACQPDSLTLTQEASVYRSSNDRINEIIKEHWRANNGAQLCRASCVRAVHAHCG